MPTPKQEKLIKLVLENIGTKGTTKTLGNLLKEAGYSEAICKNPYLIFGSDTVQEEMTDVVDMMKKERERALKALTTKNLDEVKYDKITDVIDKLTKNIQLLGGKPTEITKNDLSELSNDELRKLAYGESEGHKTRGSEERVSEKES